MSPKKTRSTFLSVISILGCLKYTHRAVHVIPTEGSETMKKKDAPKLVNQS